MAPDRNRNFSQNPGLPDNADFFSALTSPCLLLFFYDWFLIIGILLNLTRSRGKGMIKVNGKGWKHVIWTELCTLGQIPMYLLYVFYQGIFLAFTFSLRLHIHIHIYAYILSCSVHRFSLHRCSRTPSPPKVHKYLHIPTYVLQPRWHQHQRPLYPPPNLHFRSVISDPATLLFLLSYFTIIFYVTIPYLLKILTSDININQSRVSTYYTVLSSARQDIFSPIMSVGLNEKIVPNYVPSGIL